MPDGVLICDSRGRIVYLNRRLESMSGYRRRALIGRPVEVLVPTDMRAGHRHDRLVYVERPRARPMGSVEHPLLLRRADGGRLAVDVALGPVRRAGERRVIAVVRDVRARVALEEQLAHEALHDPLTGLANRTLFFDRLHQGLLLARRDRRQVAVVVLDVDRFKAVNDAHSHQVGDEVLRKVAATLARDIRATDTVARIGGDEFAWVLPGVGGRQAAVVMMVKPLQSVPERIVVGRKSIAVSVSAGLGLYPDDGSTADSVLRVADIHLYAAKRSAPLEIARRRGRA